MARAGSLRDEGAAGALLMVVVMRRELRLADLDALLGECRGLYESGYERRGKWSLGQMCCHLRLTMESNMRGYPRWMTVMGWPLRPVLRRFALPRILDGRSINGVKTAGMFVPAEGLDDGEELAKLERCVAAFRGWSEELHAHPGFGAMSKDGFERFHAAHGAHHLGFLVPLTE